MSLFRQEKPAGLNPSAPGKTRAGLWRVEFYLDEDDLKLLDALVAASGLRKRARFLRWLLWVWKDLQLLELGDHPEVLPNTGQMHIGVLVDNDPEHPVKLGLAKQRFRGVAVKKLPEGWRKG